MTVLFVFVIAFFMYMLLTAFVYLLLLLIVVCSRILIGLFFHPTFFQRGFKSQLPTQFFVSAPLSGARPPNDLYTIIVLAILRCDARFFQPSISEVAERRALFMYSCSVFVHFF